MSGKMKMFLYEVSQQVSLVGAIDHIKSLDMEDRVKNISDYDMKLEEINLKTISGRGLYFMDFCKHRNSGPGRAKRDEKIKGFNLASDEAFGEMTSVLYDQKTHFLVVQYNHYGPRAGVVARYLSEFSTNQSFLFEPRLKDDVLSEIDKKQYNNSLSFKYSSAALTDAHRRDLGVLVAFDNLEKLGNNIGEVEITIKKKRGNYQKMRNQVSFMKKLLRIANTDQDSITSAKVVGAMTPEDAPEVLNLLNANIFQEREGLVRDEITKMYSFESRCKLLADSFNQWKNSGVITAGPR